MKRIEEMARRAGCTDLQIWTLIELAKGRTVSELAAERGVTERGVWYTRKAALRRIAQKPNNRRAQVIGLRAAGHSWDYIGHEMGISGSAACRLHRRAVEQ